MKTSNSQSIDAIISKTAGGAITREQARLALYEAVLKCVPEYKDNRRMFIMLSDRGYTPEQIYAVSKQRMAGYNKCRAEVLTNLATLFGITKEGGSDE